MEVNAGRSKDCMKPQILRASSGWVETWRLNMNYAIGLATRYSTASEATGCRHSIIARTLKTVVECRHPVASLAVLC